jgi:hypothetical protein
LLLLRYRGDQFVSGKDRHEWEPRLTYNQRSLASCWESCSPTAARVARPSSADDASAVTILLGLLAEASEHLVAGSSALFNQHDLVQMPDYRQAAPAN